MPRAALSKALVLPTMLLAEPLSLGCGVRRQHWVGMKAWPRVVSTTEIPSCLQCDRYAWCVSLEQLLIFWVVLEEALVLDWLKIFGRH